MFRNFGIIVTFLALGAFLLSPRAMATDDKVYSAAICTQEGTGGTYKIDDRGRIWNLHTSQTLTVGCPIVRDDTGGRMDQAFALVKDMHYSKNVVCTVANWSKYGVGYNGFSTRSSTSR